MYYMKFAVSSGTCKVHYFKCYVKATELKKKAERFKKAKVQDEIYFDQEKQLFCDQLKAVRSALKSSQVECDMLKKELDKEVDVWFCLAITSDFL